MKLSSINVKHIILECLFKEGEDTTDHIRCEGIINTIGFHPGRIQQYHDDIFDMLKQLPTSFMKSSGGGHSFLAACMTNEEEQWGEHQSMEELMLLGLAIKKVEYCLPREMWQALPGHMPYFMVKDEDETLKDAKTFFEI